MLISDDQIQAKAQAIMKAEGPRINMLIALARNALDIDSLVNHAEAFSKIINKHTPCSNGCSHCCYMGVAISDGEAKAISRFTGRQMHHKGKALEFALEYDAKQYATIPCTFLEDGKCSIYPVRPIACRLHHNLNDDASNCVVIKVLDSMETTPSLDVRPIQFKAVDLALQAQEGFGDIRQYFPKEP